MIFGSKVSKLRDKVNKALRRERFDKALELYSALQTEEPEEPRWPHRKGDLLHRLERNGDAIDAYEVAVTLYAGQGFLARAIAMAKVVLSIDPERTDILAKVDPEAARRLHREQRAPAASAAEDLAAVGRPSLAMDAITLQPAEDADDDEVRFADVAEDELVIEIDLTDAEVAPPPPPVPEPSVPVPVPPEPELELELEEPVLIVEDDDDEWDDDEPLLLFDEEVLDDARPQAADLASLPALPLLAEVPKSVLSTLMLRSELIDLKDGEALVQVGEPADALFTIVEGHARVIVPGVGTPVALEEGAVIGESCLLDHVQRRADVLAQGRLRVLRIPKTLLDEVVADHPIIGDLLLELLSRRLISNLLLTSEVFAAFDPQTRKDVSKLFELRRAEEGTQLLAAGKRSDGLYVPLLGRLTVDPDGIDPVDVGPGHLIGMRSLITREPSELDCVAQTDVLALRLPSSRFTELAALYPPVLAHLSFLASQPVSSLGEPIHG